MRVLLFRLPNDITRSGLNMPDVQGWNQGVCPRIEFDINKLFLPRNPWRFTALGTGCAPLLQCHGHSSLLPREMIQVAQLSQKDRAAGWVSNGQKWKTGTEGQYLQTGDSIGLYSTNATYLASKEIEMGEKTQNKGCYAV